LSLTEVVLAESRVELKTMIGFRVCEPKASQEKSRMSQIPTDKFGWWIFGYQKFSEDIIKQCLCHARGWRNITESVENPKPEDVVKEVDTRPDWRHPNLDQLRREACRLLDNCQKAIVFDAAFLDGEEVIVDEFKSWGGSQMYAPERLKQDLQNGWWFPDRLAIRSVRHDKRKRRVSRFVFATNLKGCTAPAPFSVGDLSSTFALLRP